MMPPTATPGSRSFWDPPTQWIDHPGFIVAAGFSRFSVTRCKEGLHVRGDFMLYFCLSLLRIAP